MLPFYPAVAKKAKDFMNKASHPHPLPSIPKTLGTPLRGWDKGEGVRICILSYCRLSNYNRRNPSVKGLIPSFARRGWGGFNYSSKTPPTSPCKGEDFYTRN